jgi:hypothetical protein
MPPPGGYQFWPFWLRSIVAAGVLLLVCIGYSGIHAEWKYSLCRFVGRSWDSLVVAVGTTTLGIIIFSLTIPVLTLLISVFVNRAFRRRAMDSVTRGALTDSILPTLISLGAVVIALSALFMFYVGRGVYQDHADLVMRIHEVATSNTRLQQELKRKTYVPDFRDPAFDVMAKGVRAFMSYRRSIGPEAECRILTTEPSDNFAPQAGDVSMALITIAVLGSKCPNGNLQNIGVKPENVEAESKKGMISGIVILHALPGTKGADRLVDDLGNILQVRRSYTLPLVKAASENTIWLQLGQEVKWNSEL